MLKSLTLALIFSVASIGQALSQPTNMCEPLIRRYEAAHGIPNKLLTAISLVESGRKVGGSVVAWPWTINANGKPYVFGTKYEAIRMVRKLRQIGITSIDVGCMQVNLKQHPGAFPTLEAAFDPATNIAYAAKFLKAKKMNKGSWFSAVGHYHSSTAKFHTPYKARVLKTWNRVQNGKMSIRVPLEPELSPLEIIQSEMGAQEGEIVKNIAAPSGRKVPMVVRFAPYKGFEGGGAGVSHFIPHGRLGVGPKIIRGIGKRGSLPPKIIINKVGLLPDQKKFQFEGTKDSDNIIHVSVNKDREVLPTKPKVIIIPKSPSAHR